jgi:hypothetical protein
MMWLVLAATAQPQTQFFARMNEYIACLSAGETKNLSAPDMQSRARIYRNAAARCQPERQQAIDAAARERRPGISEADARAQAIDIIDTLDPLSSCAVAGARC